LVLTDKATDDGTEILDLVDNTLGLAGVGKNVDLVRVLAHIQGGLQTGENVGVRSGTETDKQKQSVSSFFLWKASASNKTPGVIKGVPFPRQIYSFALCVNGGGEHRFLTQRKKCNWMYHEHGVARCTNSRILNPRSPIDLVRMFVIEGQKDILTGARAFAPSDQDA